jgi:hypothetical protein
VFGQPSGRLPRHWLRLGCNDEFHRPEADWNSRDFSIFKEISMLVISDDNCDTVIAEYIRTKGVTRCPTACVVPTQASVTAADRAALEEYRSERDRQRREKAATRARLFWGIGSSVG